MGREHLSDRGDIDDKAVLDVRVNGAIVGDVNLIGLDEFDVANDVVSTAEVKHQLCLADTTCDRL